MDKTDLSGADSIELAVKLRVFYLVALFQKTFEVSSARPTAEEFYQLISQL